MEKEKKRETGKISTTGPPRPKQGEVFFYSRPCPLPKVCKDSGEGGKKPRGSVFAPGLGRKKMPQAWPAQLPSARGGKKRVIGPKKRRSSPSPRKKKEVDQPPDRGEKKKRKNQGPRSSPPPKGSDKKKKPLFYLNPIFPPWKIKDSGSIWGGGSPSSTRGKWGGGRRRKTRRCERDPPYPKTPSWKKVCETQAPWKEKEFPDPLVVRPTKKK